MLGLESQPCRCLVCTWGLLSTISTSKEPLPILTLTSCLPRSVSQGCTSVPVVAPTDLLATDGGSDPDASLSLVKVIAADEEVWSRITVLIGCVRQSISRGNVSIGWNRSHTDNDALGDRRDSIGHGNGGRHARWMNCACGACGASGSCPYR